MSAHDVYLHGTSPSEQDRLGLMNRLINDACLRALAPRGEMRALDVGCGLAHFTRALARALPDGAVVIGVEGDRSQLAAAGAGDGVAVELRHGRAESLPLAAAEVGSFDLVHARFLLEHHRDPLAVVREMVRAARPGGRIAAIDDDHDVLRTWPPTPRLSALWQAFTRAYDRIGCDPFVGRRMVSLLCAAGARPTRVEGVFYGGCRGQDAFDPLIDNLVRVLGSARDTLRAAALADDDDFDAVDDEVARWRRRDDATLWYTLCYAEGRRPA